MIDDIVLDNNLDVTSISFFVAKRPGGDLEIDWFQFSIDGVAVKHGPVSNLPGDQGIWVSLGFFSEGRTFDLRWGFRTGFSVPSGPVLLGHFPGRRLRDATRLKQLQLEMLETYSGSTSLTVS